jgi:Ser/Thr protein kinase RdoA (MazF antagonist)
MTVSDHAAPGSAGGGSPAGSAGPDEVPPELAEFRREMYTRTSLDWLPAHLEERYGVPVSGVTELDLGVYRVGLGDGRDWVARVFPAARPASGAAGDAELLRFVSEGDFPAERCAVADPVSELDGQRVLVTEYVAGVPRAGRRAAVARAGGLRRLGELLGVLHTMPGGPQRPGGAWHHLADGGPRAEIDAARRMLAAAAPLAGSGRALAALRAELDGLDDCGGLPQALLHPDFVLPNVVASAQRGLVLVDWTGGGRGPRLWSLGFLLYAVGAGGDLARVDRAVAGYRERVTPEPQELDRLAAAVRARPVIFATWGFGMGRAPVAAAARDAAEARERGEVIAARARAAFTA